MPTSLSWCKLTNHGVLRFEGADAQSFLQGQLTNDVTALDATRSQYNGYCTPKGRLLAAMLMWQRDGAYYMLLPRALCEPLRKRLSMYILRAKVKASDVTDGHALFGVCGDAAASALAATQGPVPAEVHAAVHGESLSLLKLPGERFLLAAVSSIAGKVEQLLRPHAAEEPPALWDALDIAAGIPAIVPATQEQFVPQTVNFDLIHAVSFDKGCYPGQEIVARTRYLGKIKQRMLRARIASIDTPAAGDKLYSATFGDQACGHIVSAVRIAGDCSDALAVVHLTDVGHNTVHWNAPAGPALEFAPLPYPVA